MLAAVSLKASSSSPLSLSCPRSYPGPEFSGYDSHLRKEGREGWREEEKEGERKGKEKEQSEKPTSVQGRPSESFIRLLGNRKEGPAPRLDLAGVQLWREGTCPPPCVWDKQRPIREMEFPWQALDLMNVPQGHLSLY